MLVCIQFAPVQLSIVEDGFWITFILDDFGDICHLRQILNIYIILIISRRKMIPALDHDRITYRWRFQTMYMRKTILVHRLYRHFDGLYEKSRILHIFATNTPLLTVQILCAPSMSCTYTYIKWPKKVELTANRCIIPRDAVILLRVLAKLCRHCIFVGTRTP